MSKKRSMATKQSNTQRAAERAAAIRAEQERKERRRRTLVVSLSVLAVLAVVIAIAVVTQSRRDTTGEATGSPSGAVSTYGLPYGEAGAPVSISIYEDFMCPYCGQFEAGSRETLVKYVDQGDVQVEYKVLSFLDRASNGTNYSTRAMNALGVVLDSAGPEVAKGFHDLLFVNQPEEGGDGLSDEELVGFAVEAGATEADVAGPIESLKFEQWVKNATDAASKADVATTPTVMVDGEVIEIGTFEDLPAMLTEAIESALND